MPEIALRPRSGTELLDAAFQLLRENFKLLFTVVLGAFLPIIGFEVLAAAEPTGGVALLSMIVTVVFESLASAAVIAVVSERYMGRSITAGEALSRIWSRIGTVVGTSIVYSFIVAVGFLLLIIPGFYFATRFFAMMPAVVIENYNSSTSQKRSSQLTDGSKMRVFGLFVVAWIIYLVLLGVAMGIGVGIFGEVAGVVIARILMAAVYPFLGIIVTLLYYDLRIRNEGLDLDIMMAQESARPVTA